MLKDETGKQYGRWKVLRFAGTKDKCSYWWCKCDCGKTPEREVKGYHLRSEVSTSCGCYQKEVASKMKLLPNAEGAFRQLFHTYRQIALKYKEVPFEITRDEFRELTKGKCFYCGVEPRQILQRAFGTPYTYNGVDRLDSSKGYSVDNCVSSCGTHNLMKLDMSVDEFIEACHQVAATHPRKMAATS